MKVTLDLDQLLQEQKITQEEYDRLSSLAARSADLRFREVSWINGRFSPTSAFSWAH